MKMIKLAVIVGVVLMAGCAQRYVSPEEQAMTNAAYKGAAMQQALQNAHNAAFGESGNNDAHHKHHNHRTTGFEDEINVDNGVVYRNGKKGYYTADGEFMQYAQSAHKHIKPNASYKQLTNEAEAVINGTIGDGADFLISQGWKANNGKWHKQGYTITLVVEKGIVLNAQLSK